MTCDACHRGTAMPTTDFKIDMGFSISNATYPGFQNTVESGTFTGYNALSNGYTWNSSWTGTTVHTAPNYDNRCSNIYCHGSTLTGGSNTAPSWVGGASEAACGTCHGASASAPPTAGSHTKHASSASGNLNLACTKCHASVTDGSHVNGSVAWDLDDTDTRIGASATYRGSNAGQTGQLAPSASYGSCSNIYCHSDVQPNGGTGSPTYASVAWGGSVTCSSCHVDMSTSPSATGSHIKHAQTQGYACSVCHSGAGSGTTLHADYNIDVAFSGIAAGGSYSQSPNPPGNGYGTCSSVYCHSDGKGNYQTPTWGGTVACGDCHTVPPTTGAHAVHFGGTTAEAAYGDDGRLSTTSAYKFNCGNCHPLDSANHGNGTVEIELYNASATGFKANNPSTATKSGTGNSTVCDNVYCHSNGADGANLAYKTTPQWGSTFGTNKCGGCHDNPPQYAGQSHYNASGFMGKEGGHLVGVHFDNIYDGVAGSGLLTAGTGGNNSHGNSVYSTTISCYICHSTVVSSSTVDTYALNNVSSSAMKCSNCHTGSSPTPLQNGVIADKSLHINAQKDVAIVNAFTMKSKAQLRDDSRPSMWTRNVGYKVSGAYDSATINSTDWDSGTKTCTTACHNNQPVQWGATNVTCNSCHTDL